jgi:hypothetical protein
MVDQSAVGREFTPVTARVEPGRLRFFLDTLGENNPLYRDAETATGAGYAALPVPPRPPRWRARGSVCSTISGSAAPAS